MHSYARARARAHTHTHTLFLSLSLPLCSRGAASPAAKLRCVHQRRQRGSVVLSASLSSSLPLCRSLCLSVALSACSDHLVQATRSRRWFVCRPPATLWRSPGVGGSHVSVPRDDRQVAGIEDRPRPRSSTIASRHGLKARGCRGSEDERGAVFPDRRRGVQKGARGIGAVDLRVSAILGKGVCKACGDALGPLFKLVCRFD